MVFLKESQAEGAIPATLSCDEIASMLEKTLTAETALETHALLQHFADESGGQPRKERKSAPEPAKATPTRKAESKVKRSEPVKRAKTRGKSGG